MGLSDRTVYVRYALRNALLPRADHKGIVFSRCWLERLVERVLVGRVLEASAECALSRRKHRCKACLLMDCSWLGSTRNRRGLWLADPRAAQGVMMQRMSALLSHARQNGRTNGVSLAAVGSDFLLCLALVGPMLTLRPLCDGFCRCADPPAAPLVGCQLGQDVLSRSSPSPASICRRGSALSPA